MNVDMNLPWAVVNKNSREVISTHASRSKARSSRTGDGAVVKTSELSNASSVTRPTAKESSSESVRRPTKKDRAREIVSGVVSNGGGRKEALEALQSELGMSKAGANTYFYLVK